MNQNIGTRVPLQRSPSQDRLKPPRAILDTLAFTESESDFITVLSRKFTVREFQLGVDLSESKPSDPNLPNSPHHSVQREHLSSDLYLVCRGRVRLLCFDPNRQREVTVQVLEEGATFGADRLLDARRLDRPLAYRAIAASEGQVACLPAATLSEWIDQFPRLFEHLQQQAQVRSRLIFFKTQTELRSLSSHQLQAFVPDVVEELIPAGSRLTEAMPMTAGRFWLQVGQIQGQTQSSIQSTNSEPPAPQVGDSWGYPHPVPSSWQAETELQIYRLPRDAWEQAASWVADLAATAVKGGRSVEAASPTGGAIAPVGSPQVNQPIAVPSLPLPVPLPAAESSTPATDSSPIFPKPARRLLLDFLSRYPWVEQQSSSDCGAACLAMISRYWGKRFPIHVLREQANVGRSGASLKSLANAAERLGFHARPVRASVGRLAEQSNPWIAHWQGTHFVVVYQIKGQRVIIADPAVGRRSLSRQEFCTHWTGYALLLDPTERLHQTEIKQASLGRYLQALVPYRSIAFQIILFSLLIQLFGLVTPMFTQIILDRVVVQRSLTTLNVFAVGLLLFGVWSIGLTSTRQYLLSYFSNRLDLTLISGFINHVLTLPLKFFESRRVGDIITRVQENQKIQRFLIQQVVLAWLNFLTGFVYLGLMLYYNWQLTLLVLALIPPIVILTLGATPFLRRISREIFASVADQNSVLVEMMTGVETVKAAAAEKELRWRWEDLLTHQLNTQFRGQKLGIGLQAASGLINSVGSTMLLWYGATLVIQDQLTIGQFVAFNMMMGYVISPVVALANLWDELQEVLISVERLNDVFEAKPEESPQHLALVLPPIRGAVKFEDVTFRYNEDEEQNTLQNISFQVQPGQTVAVVGRSGSGKSTLIKLLEGLYHPNRGRVVIDGHDIRHVSPPSLRSQLGVVPQDCFLFSGTILENITLYRPEFTLEQAVEVAKLAEAHAFIQALPLGYNTKVGERGSSLSGGQRQRIAIARALLGDPRILALDEATSALDTESERRFQRNLSQLSRDRTTFIIAHRLSTVRNADQILVLDRGVLVEQGNHAELMVAQGLYYHLAQQQLDL